MVTVRRDPFARGEYKRFCVANPLRAGHPYPAGTTHCDWCGQGQKRMYSYVWWDDAKPEPQHDSGYWFCNLDCFAAFHNR